MNEPPKMQEKGPEDFFAKRNNSKEGKDSKESSSTICKGVIEGIFKDVGNRIGNKLGQSIIYAVIGNDMDKVLSLLEIGASINTR